MKKNTNQILDETLNAIRDEAIADSELKPALDRVWARVAAEMPAAAQHAAQAEALRDCHDFQTLIPAYLSKQLSAARVLLFEDHSRECFACRKALKDARTRDVQPVAAAPAGQKLFWFNLKQPVFRFAFAAVLVVGFGLGSWTILEYVMNSFKVFNAVVLAANGPVYRVADQKNIALTAGEKINRGERIRTAKGAKAMVQLADGTQVELAERSEFALNDSPDGTTIQLNQGNVIVEAAKQKNGKHLYVKTEDALVSVVGTIFSVNNGTKGSRVSVLEGEVHVEHNNNDTRLLPGDQVTTNNSIERVAIQEEVAWSANSTRYQELLAEVAKVRQEIKALPRPGVRYSTRILDLLPERTVFYAALPNLSEPLSASYEIIQQRVAQSPELQAWWNKNHQQEADKVFATLQEFGAYLGAEITMSVPLNTQGKPDEPLFVAELKNADGFNTALTKLGVKPLQLINDPATAQAEAGKELFVWLHKDLLVAAPRLSTVQQFAASLQSAGGNPFKAGAFYQSIAKRYQEGTSLILAADLAKITPQLADQNRKANVASEQLGLTNLKHFIAEIKDNQSNAQNSAELTFNEANKGIAAWLAAPAPMGSLNYISQDANVVGAFVVKDPTAMADNLINTLKAVEPKFGEALATFESTHSLNVRNDIAAPLGGEFAFALDGPVLPLPSWKIVVEVYDQPKLQQTLEQVVAELNRFAQKNAKQGFTLTNAVVGEQTFYVIKSLDYGAEIHYAFVRGYMIATPSKALIDRAIRYAESGSTIVQSPRFIASLPADKQANFSALLYQNLAPIVSPIAKSVGTMTGKMQGNEAAALTSLAADAPSLAYVYSFGDRITVSVNSEHGAINLGDLLSMPGSLALQSMIKQSAKK